jgi:hypothetical protein
MCPSVCEWVILAEIATIVACPCEVSCLGNETIFIILRAEAEKKFEHPACISHIRLSMLMCLGVCEWVILAEMATIVACLCEVICLDNETVFIILRGSVQVRAEAEEKVEHPACSYNREQPGCTTPKDEKRPLNSNRAISNLSDFSVEQINTSCSLMSHRACRHTCYTIQLMHYSHFKTNSL